MSIKLGIYDFFAYMIPGGIGIVAFLFVFINHFGLLIDFTNISASYLIIFAITSYLAGFVIDSISGRLWLNFFHPKNHFEKTINEFNERNPYIKVTLQEMDWSIVLSFIRNKNTDIADTIDKLNAQSKMLKSSSFGIIIFAIIFLFEFLFSNYYIPNLIFSISCFVIALILVKHAVKFREWFYVSIFQSYVSIIAKPEFLPVKLFPKTRIKRK